MWLITGPFDNDKVKEDIPNKTKLLKSATTYILGRNPDCTLRIDHKKVSRYQGEIIIGNHSDDDITNCAPNPSLTYRNTRDIDVRVTRGDKSFVVAAQSNRNLESGDIIRLSTDVIFTVVWRPVVCFVSEESSTFNRDACSCLGIKLVTKHTRDVTHHIISSIPSPLSHNILLSLLSEAIFVTPQWLTTFLDSANSLYQTYSHLPEANYTPNIDSQLSTIHRDPKLLSPNGNRKNLFGGLIFLFAVIGSGIGSETKAMADVVICGGGERNMVDVEKEAAGPVLKNSWDTLLNKKARVTRKDLGKGIIPVGDDAKMHERGTPRDIQKTWDKMVEKANIAGLRVIHPSVISDAIVKIDVSLLDCTAVSQELQRSKSQMELGVPVRQEKELSQQAESSTSQPTRRLTRRAASKPPVADVAPSSPPPVAQEPSTSDVANKRKEPERGHEENLAPRKVLKRRAKATELVNALLGLDNPSTDSQPISAAIALEDAAETAVVNVPAPVPLAEETQPRRPLKRRARNNSQSQFSFFPEDDGLGAPSLKKFKTLFEESGRGEVSSLPVENGDAFSVPPAMNLEALREEEEETQPSVQTPARSRPTRRLPSIEENIGESQDTTMRDSPSEARKERLTTDNGAIQPSQDLQQPAASKRSGGNEVSAETDKTKAKGADPGNPDKDLSFLKAIASLKRGKRAEDSFDREFNQLRISKPKIQDEKSKENEAPYTWDGLDNFERDIGIRGNFMQIVELEIWRDQGRVDRYQGERVNWQGRNDFKKFKKKGIIREREDIPLEPVGFQDHVDELSIDYRPRPKPAKRRIPVLEVLVEPGTDEDEDGHPILTGRSKSAPRTRAPPRTHEKPPSFSNRKASKTAAVEYLEIDDEDEEDEIRPFSGRSTRKASARPVASSSRKTSNPDPLFIEDSEDEIEEVTVPKRALRSTQGQSQSQSQSQNLSRDLDFMDTSETLKSDPKESQTQGQSRGLKRKAALAPVVERDDEDEPEDDGTFGGFTRRRLRRRLGSS